MDDLKCLSQKSHEMIGDIRIINHKHNELVIDLARLETHVLKISTKQDEILVALIQLGGAIKMVKSVAAVVTFCIGLFTTYTALHSKKHEESIQVEETIKEKPKTMRNS